MNEAKLTRNGRTGATKKPKPKPTTTAFSWQGAGYTRVDPGIYDATVKVVIPPEWVRLYGRWVVKIIFTLHDDRQDVPLFLNMGNDQQSPSIARNSEYRKWWTAANGALPDREEAMLPDVFTQGQIFRVEVADANLNESKTAIYSKVIALVAVNRPSLELEHEHEHDGVNTSYINSSSSSSRSPHHAHPIKRGIGDEPTANRSKQDRKSSKPTPKTQFSASPRPGDGNAITQNATQKSGSFDSRSGNRTLTIH
jgi:hypothetical protein